MLGKASNPMLEQAEQVIQANLPANMQPALQQVVNAGLTVMYSAQTAQARKQAIMNTKNPVTESGEGAARLISNLFQQSNKTMPPGVILPAACIFAFEYLDFMAKAGKVTITPDIIANSTHAVIAAVLPLMSDQEQQQNSTINPSSGILSNMKQSIKQLFNKYFNKG